MHHQRQSKFFVNSGSSLIKWVCLDHPFKNNRHYTIHLQCCVAESPFLTGAGASRRWRLMLRLLFWIQLKNRICELFNYICTLLLRKIKLINYKIKLTFWTNYKAGTGAVAVAGAFAGDANLGRLRAVAVADNKGEAPQHWHFLRVFWQSFCLFVILFGSFLSEARG